MKLVLYEALTTAGTNTLFVNVVGDVSSMFDQSMYCLVQDNAFHVYLTK